jgi:UDP-N-acetylglucosamine:LPS N-acetylglucosamine transferase
VFAGRVMPFPEFDPTKKKVLFFSRGRGRGHAIPDIEIVKALSEICPDIDVRMVSYSTGASTISSFGLPLIDIGMPDTSPIAETSVAAGKLIGWLNPSLVVAHEEFAVAPASKIFGKPCLVLTDFFSESDLYSMHALKFADQILFLGREGVFDELPWVKGKVHYIGPVLRPFTYQPGDRERARRDLGVASEAFVIGVFPGSWAEDMAPILDSVTQAFHDLPAPPPAKLVWVAGADFELVRTRFVGHCDVLVYEQYWEIDRLMVASDVAITKANRMSVFELIYFGVPVIAISFDLNPTDDRAISGIEAVLPLPGKNLSGAMLGDAIRRAAALPKSAGSGMRFSSGAVCVRYINELLNVAARGK